MRYSNQNLEVKIEFGESKFSKYSNFVISLQCHFYVALNHYAGKMLQSNSEQQIFVPKHTPEVDVCDIKSILRVKCGNKILPILPTKRQFDKYCSLVFNQPSFINLEYSSAKIEVLHGFMLLDIEKMYTK